IDVRPTRCLDPGGDVVVVLVALLVVEKRLRLKGILGQLDRDRLAESPGGLECKLERVVGDSRIAAGAQTQELDHVHWYVRGLRDAADGIAERPAKELTDVLRLERPELVDLTPGEKRRVDLEIGILGGCSDQSEESLLDRGEERVLLCLVEAVDLVQEEHGPGGSPRGTVLVAKRGGTPPVLGSLDHRANFRASRVDRAGLLEGSARLPGSNPSEGRLAAPRRTVEDHGRRIALLDRRPQGGARSKQVVLSDEVLEGARPHPGGKRLFRDRNCCALGG